MRLSFTVLVIKQLFSSARASSTGDAFADFDRQNNSSISNFIANFIAKRNDDQGCAVQCVAQRASTTETEDTHPISWVQPRNNFCDCTREKCKCDHLNGAFRQFFLVITVLFSRSMDDVV